MDLDLQRLDEMLASAPTTELPWTDDLRGIQLDGPENRLLELLVRAVARVESLDDEVRRLRDAVNTASDSSVVSARVVWGELETVGAKMDELIASLNSNAIDVEQRTAQAVATGMRRVEDRFAELARTFVTGVTAPLDGVLNGASAPQSNE